MDFLVELNQVRPDILVVKSRSALVSRSRNEGIFNRYLDLRFPIDLLEHEVYVFLDGDVLPDLSAFLHVIDYCDADTFGTGIYEARGKKAMALGDFMGPLILSFKKEEVARHDTAEWAGGGLIFAGRNVLAKLEFPYFHESVISWRSTDGAERAAIIGEDVSFCMKARGHGFKLKIFHELEAEHLTEDEDPKDPEEEEQ
jgi:hypothetical protein